MPSKKPAPSGENPDTSKRRSPHDPLGRRPMVAIAPPKDQGKPWEPEELDSFLEHFLSTSNSEAYIANLFDRTPDGVKVLPWKLATRYIDYTPGPKRASRAGARWVPRELTMLRQGFDAIVTATRGVTLAYLAALVARPEAEVLEFYEKESKTPASRRKGFL